MQQEIMETLRAMVPPERQEHILVIDDEAPVRDTLVTLLERDGYVVTAAADAADALIQLQDDPGCDLVLSDVMMSGTDGLGLLDAICRDYPGVPVVMLTAVHDIHVATNAFRRGAIDYLLKPFDRSQLMGVVSRAIEHGHLLKQNSAYRQNLEQIVSARTGRLRAAMHDLERSYDITLEAMGDALDLRDSETEGHSRRVTAYTVVLAREMGVKADDLRIIARGAFLHDIGKIATPDCILLKPGKLDVAETEIMRKHCTLGYEMVRKIPFLREAAEIVHAHQETFDGRGYPRGLGGEEIPLGARIFAVADAFDAMTSDRPYRKGMSSQQAREELKRCSGTQFDPHIVEVFLGMPEELWGTVRAEVERAPAGAFGMAI